MNSSLRVWLLRPLVLVAGAACAALIFVLALNSWKFRADIPLLQAQCAFVFVVSGLSLAGISVSAFCPARLRASRLLRRVLVTPAVMFPLNDFFPVLAGGRFDSHLIAALVMSAAVGSVIALAVASSWLPVFKGTKPYPVASHPVR